MGQVLIGGPWDLAICGKRMSVPDLPGEGTLGFPEGSGVLVPVMPVL